jgi:hypothetical protein
MKYSPMNRTGALVIGSASAGFLLAAWIGWSACPKYIDEQGVLREPFALIPLGYLAAAATLGSAAVLAFACCKRK